MSTLPMPERKQPITNEQLVSAMERLIAAGELRDGKVLIVHDPALTPRITALRIRAIDYPLPIIIAKEGNLTTVDVEELRRIVQEYDERNAAPTVDLVAENASTTEGW